MARKPAEMYKAVIYELLKFYLNNRAFYVKDSCSAIYSINAGVLQESVLDSVLYTLYTSDIPTTPVSTMYTFTDDTGTVATHKYPEETANIL